MNQSVNLTNLRDMIGGDKEMEKSLFEEFFSSFEAGIGELRAHCGENAAEAWRAQSHSLKGVALNLGAEPLGHLCKKGQDEPFADTDAKSALIKNIQEEYAKVKGCLLAQMSSGA